MSAGNDTNEPASRSPFDESAEELYDLAPCGYLTTAADGGIVKVNRTLCKWLGYEALELTGRMRFSGLLTVGGRIFYDTHVVLMLRMRGAVEEIAFDLIRKDGTVMPGLVNASQKRNAAGEPVLNRFTVFNATERRMYERQLLATRNTLRTTLSSIGDGVIATDTEGCVTFLNPVAEALTAWTHETALGKRVEEVLRLVNEETGAVVANPIRQALLTGEVVGLANHTTLLARDGREIPLDDSASPIREDNGNVVGAVVIFRDISSRRRAERELQQAHLELEIQAAELRRSNEDLSQFSYVASHDLRSPLNTVIQFAELLDQEYGDRLGDGREVLHYLQEAAGRMGRLIEDLLLYAGLESGPAAPPEPGDAEVSFRAAVDNLRTVAARTGALVTSGPLPKVAVRESHLLQVLQNLIGNAIHYRTAEPPSIHVSAADDGAYWRFACGDNGIGIAPEYQSQIFEPFKRLHGQERPGSGIGLAVCRRIVNGYGGRIWVESRPGAGSTFYFTLPKGVPPA